MDAALVARVHRAFSDAGVDYALVGRTAASLWEAPMGPRQHGSGQAEVEVLAFLPPGEVDGLLAAAAAQGFTTDAGLAAHAVEGGEHLTLFPREGGAFVDVKPARGASDLAALRARTEFPLGAGVVHAATLEETVVRLLDEGSQDSLDLAKALLQRWTGEVDPGYLGQRAEELRVGHLLREVGGPTLLA
jgi:hypothetical protein